MGRIKQSATAWSFVRDDMTPERFLNGLADIGFDGVELIAQEYWGMAKDLGLTVVTFGGHATLTDGLNRPENHDRIEQEILENLELAAEHGVPGLICFSGNRYDSVSDEEGIDITAEGLSRVAKAAEEQEGKPLPRTAQQQSEPPRLPVRSDGVGCGSLQACQFTARQVALRHLSHANYGGRPHPDDWGEYRIHRSFSYGGKPRPQRLGRRTGD